MLSPRLLALLRGYWKVARPARSGSSPGASRAAPSPSGSVHSIPPQAARVASSPSRRGDPKLLHDLGTACEAIGLVPEARAWYGLAIARDPTSPEAQAALYRIGTSSPPTRTGGAVRLPSSHHPRRKTLPRDDLDSCPSRLV